MPLFAVASASTGRDACDRFRAANPGYPLGLGFIHDLASVDREALVRAGLITADNGYDRRELARALCHVALWRRCVEADEIIHVADDRAVVRGDFADVIGPHVAGAFDVVVWGIDLREPAWIGYAPGVEGRLLHDQSRELPDAASFQAGRAEPVRFRLLHCPDPVGYTVSPDGARRLLERCVPFGGKTLPYFAEPGAVFGNGAFDREMARHYRGLRAFILQPLLAMVVEAAHPGIVTEHFIKAFRGLAGQQDLRLFSQP